jgi:DNA-binding MarR family transcriptional regulator
MTSKKDFPYEFLSEMDEKTLIDTLGCEANALKEKRKEDMRQIVDLNDVLLYMRYAFGYQDCNLSYVNAFTAIAALEPVQLADLPEKLNISRSTITRLITYLGEGTTEGARPIIGLNYVKAIDDPRDSRRKIVALTPAGRVVAHNVQRLLNKGATFGALVTEQLKAADKAAERTPK